MATLPWNRFTTIIESESTGVEGAKAFKKPVDVYDLQGRKVRSLSDSLDGLPKGIYIVDGKKIIVRETMNHGLF